MADEDGSRPHEPAGTTPEERPTAGPGTPDGSDASSTGPIRTPAPQPAFGPETVGSGGGPARGWEDPPAPAAPPPSSAEVLDRPMDDTEVRDRLNRPGMARSTRILLLLLAAVVLLGLGLIIGRATAPPTGPGSVPPAVGVIQGLDTPPGGSPVITVRAPDGTLTALATTPGTVIAVPARAGNTVLKPGTQVTVTGERDQRGQTIATRVDLPAQ